MRRRYHPRGLLRDAPSTLVGLPSCDQTVCGITDVGRGSRVWITDNDLHLITNGARRKRGDTEATLLPIEYGRRLKADLDKHIRQIDRHGSAIPVILEGRAGRSMRFKVVVPDYMPWRNTTEEPISVSNGLVIIPIVTAGVRVLLSPRHHVSLGESAHRLDRIEPMC